MTMHTGFSEDEVTRAEQLGLAPYKRYEIAEAAKHLALDAASVVRLVEASELGCLKVGRHTFVLGGHIVQWKVRTDSDLASRQDGEVLPAALQPSAIPA
jgi:hypothetical protein